MHDLEGTFPFGRPSGRCAPRGRSGAAVVVLGVYPSALHVRWTHPQCRVAALAVDEEPWPFWDGADEAERIERWRRDVGGQEEWGVSTRSAGSTERPAGRCATRCCVRWVSGRTTSG